MKLYANTAHDSVVHCGYSAVKFGTSARRADRRPGPGRGHYGIIQVRLKSTSELYGLDVPKGQLSQIIGGIQHA